MSSPDSPQSDFLDFVSTDFEIGRGHPLPLGATPIPSGINFSVFASNASKVSLVLFGPEGGDPVAEFPLDPRYNRTGHIWHLLVRGLDRRMHYGYRAYGASGQDASLHRYDSDRVLIDPHAKALSGGSRWGAPQHWRCVIVDDDDFDWEHDQPLNIHLADSVIYEMHVRGFTRDPSSGVNAPGTYAGVIEKIPYLKSLGVTAVELLPVTEFDENDNPRVNPMTGEKLHNFWGYHPVNFFSPKQAYASDSRPGSQVREFKEMVKALHEAGIEVILDMVFNHTCEGNEKGETLSFRGLDNVVYYLVDEKTGKYANYSGCGNTLNCNHPVVRDLILDCLSYWVTEMHVDGFRFDLASILGRGRSGEVLSDPPLLERIAATPVLANTKLIAEAWDAAGLYQVGSFPNWGRWAEWNGRYRDDLRCLLRGDKGMIARLATRLCGSADLYEMGGRAPWHSINFITCHDGFPLYDLFSYAQKHNLANGEENRDGDNNNHSFNCGVEGDTDDTDILLLRRRLRKNALALLMFSRGVPMVLAGDELGRTQGGNNNAYCQDNELNWLDWQPSPHADLRDFLRSIIRFRQEHPILRGRFFNFSEEGGESLSWHGVRLGAPDWEKEESMALAMYLRDERQRTRLYLMVNAEHREQRFELPVLGGGYLWRRFLDTGLEEPEDLLPLGQERLLMDQDEYPVAARSLVMLVAKPQ